MLSPLMTGEKERFIDRRLPKPGKVGVEVLRDTV